MEVSEQTETNLVLKSFTARSSYIWGILCLLLGIWMLSGSLQGSNIFYQYAIGPLAVVVGLYTFLGKYRSTLNIDKSEGKVILKRWYILGLLPTTREIDSNSLGRFVVKHRRAYKLKPSSLDFVFRTEKRKFVFSSGKLHFTQSATWLNDPTADPRNSTEEKLIPVVSSYLGLNAITSDKDMDSPLVAQRLLSVTLLFAAGLVTMLVIIWFYYHIISHN